MCQYLKGELARCWVRKTLVLGQLEFFLVEKSKGRYDAVLFCFAELGAVTGLEEKARIASSQDQPRRDQLQWNLLVVVRHRTGGETHLGEHNNRR